MSAELLIDAAPRKTRPAVVENGVYQEILVERSNRRDPVGNVCNGRACRMRPGTQETWVIERLDVFVARGCEPPNGARRAGAGCLQ